MKKKRLVFLDNDQYPDHYDAYWLPEETTESLTWDSFVPLGKIEEETGLNFGQFVPGYEFFRERHEHEIALTQIDQQDRAYLEQITEQFNAGNLLAVKKIAAQANEYAQNRMYVLKEQSYPSIQAFSESFQKTKDQGFEFEGQVALARSSARAHDTSDPDLVEPSVILPPG